MNDVNLREPTINKSSAFCKKHILNNLWLILFLIHDKKSFISFIKMSLDINVL